MDWQQVASLMIVAMTAVLLVRHEVHRRQRAKQRGCGSDCGCASSRVLEQIKEQSQPKYIERTVSSK